MSTILTAIGLALLALACWVTYMPWQWHGGRFFTEHMIVSVPVGLIGAGLLYFALR